jgi:hypothetical protein
MSTMWEICPAVMPVYNEVKVMVFAVGLIVYCPSGIAYIGLPPHVTVAGYVESSTILSTSVFFTLRPYW